MEKINYIIPVCNVNEKEYDYRLKSINFLINEFLAKQTNIELNIIIIEQFINEEKKDFTSNIEIPIWINHKCIGVEYHTFVKPWLYNIGFKEAKTEHCFISEMESLTTERNFLSDILDIVKEKKYQWCFCYDKWYFLNEEQTNDYLQNKSIDSLEEIHFTIPEPKSWAGGIIYFNKDFWWNHLHGANEMYRNLIGNDNELTMRAAKSCMNTNTCQKNLFHLYHPKSDLKYPSEVINRKMFHYTKGGRNHEAVNKFLAKKNLGNLDEPLDLNDKLIDEFFKSKF